MKRCGGGTSTRRVWQRWISEQTISAPRTYIVLQDDACEALGIPEQLVDIVVANNLIMVFLPPHKLPVYDFIALIPYKPVERFDYGLQIYALSNRFSPILTLRTSVVVVGTFENEA